MGYDASLLSKRAGTLEASGIRKFFDLTEKMPNAINLSIGMAHYDVPDDIKDVAIKAIRDGQNKYSTTQGIPVLREKLRKYLDRLYGYVTDNDEVMVTSGVSGGLLLAYMNLLEPGDEILIPDPYFVMYVHLANQAGATPVFYNTYPDFRLRIEELEKKRTERTKVILINSPQNPTGTVYTEDEIKAIAEWAKKHNIFVISDEIYDRFIYDLPHVSVKKYLPEGTLVLGGMSKTWGMPGWRVGYALAPKWLYEKMVVLQQFSYVCAPPPFQLASAEGLDFPIEPWLDDYRKKRDFIYDALKDYYPGIKPQGAFYFFPEVPEKLRATFMDEVLKHQLLVVPGTASSIRKEMTHFRLSFAATDEDLERGAEILVKIAKNA